MKSFGHHLILEMWDCDKEVLGDVKRIKEVIRRAASQAGATIIEVLCHEFSPSGVTGVALLAESHLTIHTWPEQGYAAADIFTCGSSTEPQLAALCLVEALRARNSSTRELKRGTLELDPAPHETVQLQ